MTDTTALAILDPDTLKMLREQLAPEASTAELQWFGQVCRHLNLDPFKGQIELIPRWDSRVNRKVHRPQLTVEGRRAIASRTGELRGIDGPYWTGPRNSQGELVWQELWDSTEPPYAARVFVYRKDWVKPANGTVKWDEFAYIETKQGKQLRGPLWKLMPAHMLGKTAESLALRRAFSEEIDGALGVMEDTEPEPAVEPVKEETSHSYRGPLPVASSPVPASAGTPTPPSEMPSGETTNDEIGRTMGLPIDVEVTRPADGPDEHVIATSEQLDTIRGLLAERKMMVKALGSIVGHDMRTLNELSRREADTVIATLDPEEPF